MTDIRIGPATQGEAVTLDFLLTPVGDLDTTNDLATAVTVALGTDARARADDEMPDPDTDDPRGWWADTDAQQIWDAWPIGSRLWLLERTKITGPDARRGSTVARVESYIREALAPLRERKIVSKIVVRAERVGTEGIFASVELYRGPRKLIDLRYQALWADEAGMVLEPASGASLAPASAPDSEAALLLGVI